MGMGGKDKLLMLICLCLSVCQLYVYVFMYQMNQFIYACLTLSTWFSIDLSTYLHTSISHSLLYRHISKPLHIHRHEPINQHLQHRLSTRVWIIQNSNSESQRKKTAKTNSRYCGQWDPRRTRGKGWPRETRRRPTEQPQRRVPSWASMVRLRPCLLPVPRRYPRPSLAVEAGECVVF